MKSKNLTNKKIHHLTLIERAESIKSKSAWKCRCDCGNIKVILTQHLLKKDRPTKSCGCLNNKKRSERAKKWQHTNKKYSAQEASARQIWRKRYKDSNCTFEQFLEISQKNCFYCNASPSNAYNIGLDKNRSKECKENGLFVYNGLDRVDNSKPHSIDNVVPCCKYCNYAKRERNLKEFIEWIKNVHQTLCMK